MRGMSLRGLRACGGERGGGGGQGLEACNSPRAARRSPACPPSGGVCGWAGLGGSSGSCGVWQTRSATAPCRPCRDSRTGAGPPGASAGRRGLEAPSIVIYFPPWALRGLRLIFLCVYERARVFVIKVLRSHAHKPLCSMVTLRKS